MVTNDAGEQLQSTEATLKQRSTRYGDFENHSKLSVKLKNGIFTHITDIAELNSIEEFNKYFPSYMQEAVEMICHKLARIANGDPYYDDNWRDIAGYAELVVNILNRKSTTTANEPNCLLDRKFALIPNWEAYAIMKNLSHNTRQALNGFNTQDPIFYSEFSQLDDDGNITLKRADITVPFTLFKEI